MEQAADTMDRAARHEITLSPGDVTALCGMARAWRQRRQFDKARKAAARAFRIAPQNRQAWIENVMIPLEEGRSAEEAALMTRLVLIGLEQGLITAGTVAQTGGLLRLMIVLDPGWNCGYEGMWHLSRERGRLGDAALMAKRGHLVDPADPANAFQWGWSLLADGDLQAGFRTYEARRILDGDGRAFPSPEWRGEPVKGRRLLLAAEQGHGDQIQFARFVPLLIRQGAEVIFETCSGLQPLFQQSFPEARVVTRGGTLPPHDMHLPILSVGRVWGVELDTIPNDVPYLYASAWRVAAWKQRLGVGGGLKVGIVWAGNPDHEADHLRTIPLDLVMKVLGSIGIPLYALQKEKREEDVPALRRAAGRLIDLADDLTDYAETAAAIEALDLVVTVDTSVAHLAGALGRPVWLLLSAASDWRWLRDRADSPWYPSMRLYRQTVVGDWLGPLERIRADLEALARGRERTACPG